MGGGTPPRAHRPTIWDAPNENASRDLGQGWKVSQSVVIKAQTTFTIADIDGPGSIQHIWMTPTGVWRNSIIRFYWDGETSPSVEVPVSDFFCMAWNQYSSLQSLVVCVNPGSAFNCYWPMPFRKKIQKKSESDDSVSWLRSDGRYLPLQDDIATTVFW